MLQKIRDNTQGILAKIFIGFIIAVFALFGIETLIGSIFNSSTGLTVNDSQIDPNEIDSLAQRKAQEFFNNMGADADLSGFDEALFRENAISELIQRELLTQSAANSGMTVSAAAIDRQIMRTEDFQIDGVFNEERATLLLQNSGFTPNSYRATLSREAALNQILTAYSASGFVTSEELSRLVALVHQKRSFRFVSLALDSQNADIEITDAAIAEYYDNNQSSFMQDEQVKITWLELNKENMFAEVAATEEQVRALYDEEVARYQAQTERRAAHILFEATTDAEIGAATARAEEVLGKLAAGEEFSALAATYSDDTGSAEDGGDVGYTTGDSFVPEFETALQSLEVGQVSGVVKSDFGIHLIKLLEMNATEIEPYETRKDALEREMKSREVDTLFVARSEELGNLAFESVDLAEPASIMGLQIQESDWFSRAGGVGITANRGVIDSSFNLEVLEERQNSEMIQIDGNRSVIVHVTDHQLPEVRSLDAVKDEIAVTLRLEQMREQAKMIGETIVNGLNTGVNIDSLLEAQGLSWNVFELLERDNQIINPALTEEIFTMLAPAEGEKTIKGFAVETGEYFVVELGTVIDGTTQDMEEGEEQSLRSFISQQSASLDFAGFMMSQEARAVIKGRDVPEEIF